jgi:hypothetical protein
MKLSITSTALFGLVTFAATDAAEMTKYTSKEDSNQAFTSSVWQVDSCFDSNYFTIYANDGFVKTSDSTKTILKYLNGEATIYSDCTSTGATVTTFNFYATEPVLGFVISPLNNATVKTTVEAFFTKSKCVVESYEYPDSDSGKTSNSYYVCGDSGDEFESGTKTLTIDMVMSLPKDDAYAKVYSSNSRGINRGPGYIEKYETKSKCKSTVTIKNTLKWGKKTTVVIPDTQSSTTGEVCKLSKGYSERILF